MTRRNDLSETALPLGENAQGRLRLRQPVAVIDIGSNSVRQVVYEGATRAPAVLFNEKVLCGLGEGLADNAKLDDKAVARSIAAITRFRALARQIGVVDTFILATAAVRDAKNGKQFVDAIKKVSGCDVAVLTGEMEAQYSADGIKSGFHNPEGIVGDMGGGSLELAAVGKGDPKGQTFPLGGLRLRDMCGGDLKTARVIAKKHLDKCNLNWPGASRDFFAVGGTWRSLAKLHIAQNDYPLQVIHHYEIAAKSMMKFCAKVAQCDVEELVGIERVSRNRRGLLQYGAIVMEETLKRVDAQLVLMSALGVREGYLYSQLGKSERRKDMLLEAASDLATLRARCPPHCEELAQWTGEAFDTFGIDENEDERRYRKAACYLADIGWRAHPDYRAIQSVGIISNAGFVGINHEGRAYLSLANFHRYQGLGPKTVPPSIAKLAGKRVQQRARLLAALFRVGYLYSASTPGVLPRVTFEKTGPDYTLNLPRDIGDLAGERPQMRLRQLANEAEVEIKLVIV